MAGPKKRKQEKKKAQKQNESKEKKTTDQVNWPLGDSFIPSMKSQNGIFWMVHWWVLGQLKPMLSWS